MEWSELVLLVASVLAIIIALYFISTGLGVIGGP
jgi:hypothetical protein